MSDLGPRWIKVKGILFLLLGIAAAALLVLEHPTWKAAGLLALAIWCFLPVLLLRVLRHREVCGLPIQVLRVMVVCRLPVEKSSAMKAAAKSLVLRHRVCWNQA